ncbi:MAG: hypothetical protein AB7P14_15180 [Blastocatellales bacterium]
MQKELHRIGRASAARRRMVEGCGFESRRRAQKRAYVEAQVVSSILVVTTIFAANAGGTTSLTMMRSRVQLPPAPSTLRRSSSAVERNVSSILVVAKFSQRPQPE